jgi:hypothetical protein
MEPEEDTWGLRNNKRLLVCYFRCFAEQNSTPEERQAFLWSEGEQRQKRLIPG